MIPLEPLRTASGPVPVDRCGVLIVGSGAAALAAAERLAALAAAAEAEKSGSAGIAADVVVATESTAGGTSYNTGSDKQTYYRLSQTGEEGDSVRDMAAALWEGGAVHGDIALVEAAGSSEAFFRLVSLGVPFPTDRWGQSLGYKTDHDPRKRGSSIGPYTSKAMVETLLREVRARGVPIVQGMEAIALLARPPEYDAAGRIVRRGRAFGALFVDRGRLGDGSYGLRAIVADAVILGVGGPGGLYGASVYPVPQSGGIGLAIEAGAPCVNLTESQFGLASVAYRWNVSGSYQQAIPRYISVGPDGDEDEFLTPFFAGPGERDTAVFLKGYQWPFDPRKVPAGGSSLIDLLVHRERALRGRRVFMDFRTNPSRWSPAGLSAEAADYLRRSGALDDRRAAPLDRLRRMNEPAIEHYRAHGIDLAAEPLEVAVCAQHNNGGLAADAWWESTGLDRLFPVGEVNGSHGVYRPGGAALNAGQVGASRAARRILGSYAAPELRDSDWRELAGTAAERLIALADGALARGPSGVRSGDYEAEFRSRMDSFGAILRSAGSAREAATAAAAQTERIESLGLPSRAEAPRFFRDRHLVLAHAAYLEATAAYVEAGGGSRGSYLVTDPAGDALNEHLDGCWGSRPERGELREYLQELHYEGGRFAGRWIRRRPIPEADEWFETGWKAFREGAIFEPRTEGSD